MAHSLEARVPFLDPVVAELALALETKQKVRGLFKEAAAAPGGGAAAAARDHPRAQAGLLDPGRRLAPRRARPFAREVLSPETVSRQGYLDPGAVTGVLDRHISGKEDLSRQIWGLLNFTLWFDRYAREPRCRGWAGGAGGRG